jgi:hypothetical protein
MNLKPTAWTVGTSLLVECHRLPHVDLEIYQPNAFTGHAALDQSTTGASGTTGPMWRYHSGAFLT